MRLVFYVATIYLGLLGILALFMELNKWHWYWKLTLGLVAIVAVVLSIAFQHLEKKSDEESKQYAEWRAEQRASQIREKLDKLDSKEKAGTLTSNDVLLRISLELEKFNIGLRTKEGIIKEQYLTSYFTEVEKIPHFFTLEEWKETENVLFRRMDSQMSGFFSSRGTLDSGPAKALFEEFKREREKYIRAKERQYKKE